MKNSKQIYLLLNISKAFDNIPFNIISEMDSKNSQFGYRFSVPKDSIMAGIE